MNEVPEWAKGKGWIWDAQDRIATYYPISDGFCIYEDGTITFGGDQPMMPTPEDARYIADCLISGKVLPR